MTLFDNYERKDFNMNLAASGTLETNMNVQYIYMIVRGEELRQFDLFYDDVEGMEPLTAEAIILGLAAYFFQLVFTEEKSRNVPRNEKAARIKSKTICGSLN